jgi:hypothetical protein
MTDMRTLAGLLAGALLLAPLPAMAQGMLAVQASGELPGFRIEDSAPWLAAQMEKAGGGWRFAPRSGDAAAPDRVEWTFEILPYAGGQVRQFFPMPGASKILGAKRLIAAEVKLYIKGQYQTVTLGQEAVAGGDNDPILAAFITRVTQNLLNGYAAIDMTQAIHRAP